MRRRNPLRAETKLFRVTVGLAFFVCRPVPESRFTAGLLFGVDATAIIISSDNDGNSDSAGSDVNDNYFNNVDEDINDI